MSYSKPVTKWSHGPTPSGEAFELGGFLTPEDSIMNSGARKRQTHLSDSGSTAVEKHLTHTGQSSTFPDVRPGGPLCPSDRGAGEFVRVALRSLGLTSYAALLIISFNIF